MIISASRRTDIPAFYSKWFINRIKAGYLLSVNPMNRKQVSKIILDPNIVDCIVFWTKNPAPLIEKLDLLKAYKFYFQYTITPYPSIIEKYVPPLEKRIEVFKRLSDLIGPEKVIWRYDPIFLTDKFDLNFHLDNFQKIAVQLNTFTEKCVISFLDVYKKCERNLKNINFRILSEIEINLIASEISSIAKTLNIRIETCAEDLDLSVYGIKKGKCIDDELISRIVGCSKKIEKDRNQRNECGCVTSIDIGTYNSCVHNCLYCYANFKHDQAKKNFKKHNPDSEILIGELRGDEKISVRKVKKLFDCERITSKQLELF